MLPYFPQIFANKAIKYYLVTLGIVLVLFNSHTMPLKWIVFGIIEVVGFFMLSKNYTTKWKDADIAIFSKRLFWTAFSLRAAWVIFSYFFYILQTGQPFEFEVADAMGYHESAMWLRNSSWNDFRNYLFGEGATISDSGYPAYLTFVYRFLPSILVIRVFKAIIGAYTCMLMFRLASRNFGLEIGKMTAIFCMLMPNLIYYCGLHLKEVEMVFLAVFFIEKMDLAIKNQKIKPVTIIIAVLVGIILFFFRTPLGVVAIMSLAMALLFSKGRLISFGKRFTVILLLLSTFSIALFDRIHSEINELVEQSDTNQEIGLEFRSQRKSGNVFAQYASAAVFAPLIVTIPFPTMINIETQQNQQLIHGGNYVKNVMSIFVIMALISLFFSGKWREHVLPIAFMGGYLVVLALSNFAHSERFHQPILPFELMFAAYGVANMNVKNVRYFNWGLIVEFVAIIAWSWFKLAGRGYV